MEADPDRARSGGAAGVSGGATASSQALKEQVFWIERFATVEDVRAAVREFATAHSEFATTQD